MADIETTSQGWEAVKAASLLVFASAVMWELRQQRSERNAQNDLLGKIIRGYTKSVNRLHRAIAILLDRAGIAPPDDIDEDEEETK